MAKTKICPKCQAKTRGRFWRMKRAVATTTDGKTMVYANGQVAFGWARRECTSCAWLGDFLVEPQPAPAPPKPPAPVVFDDYDDYDEDYIFHHHH